MGKATRWFKGLLGIKNDKENVDNSNFGEQKDKKRWSFAKPSKENVDNSNWGRSYMSESEREQNKHAIAVAAATAAAADAAVAAAQAAVAVVRLTSKGRGTMFCGGKERFAAVKIQSVFRGYLSRKALRALKGLVKLQALVRGYLVRKRAAATLHSMQALIRAQASVRSQRARRSFNKDQRLQPDTRARKSTERFDDPRSEYHHSKRLSTNSYDTSFNSTFDDSPKIVEIDTYRPKSRSSRRVSAPGTSDSGEDQHYQNISSPLPARLSIPETRHFQDYDWIFNKEECRFSTAQSTPRFGNSNRSNAPLTPSKSVCGDSFFRPYSNYPSYMASTQSFKAKLRSHSAPRQRPEQCPNSGPKKRLSLNEIMASRNSLSGVRMQKSCSQVQERLNL